MTVIGNDLALGNGVNGGSLYNVTDGHSAMALTLALMALSRSETRHLALLPQ